MDEKRCRRCNATKKIEEFHRSYTAKDGLQPHCKLCNRVSHRSWVRADPERKRKSDAKSYRKHSKGRLETAKKYRASNPEKIRTGNRRWREANPEKVASYNLTRREREESAPGGPFDKTRPDYQQRIAFYGGLCAYCLKRPFDELDHAIPLSRGGSNFASNIRPACRQCNRPKYTKKLHFEWTPPSKKQG